MNFGPTVRIGFFGAFGSTGSGGGAAVWTGAVAVAPFFCPGGRIGRPLASRGAFMTLARSSVTTISPCPDCGALGSSFTALAQLSSAALQVQVLLHSVYKLPREPL